MMRIRTWAAVCLTSWLITLPSCAVPECTHPDYGLAECRVIAENELARLRSVDDVEIRFQDPRTEVVSSWDARGLLEQRGGDVRARVAGAGSFAISLRAEDAQAVRVQLDNVDPSADVWIDRDGVQTPVLPQQHVLGREVALNVEADRPVWIRGRRGCPSRFRVAFVSDIQTNPSQFARILEALEEEREAGDAVQQPLVAIVIPGDLTEFSRDDEFELIDEMLAVAPVPVITTPGNHDIYRHSRPHYNRTFGPGNHVTEVCDLRLVMLDTGSGAIARSVEARLPELLERGDARHLLLAMHHPPYPGLTGSGWSREDRAQRLLAEAALAQVDLIVAGHNHALRDFASIPVGDESLRQVVVGTGGAYQGVGPPRFGYLRVTLGPDSLETCFVEVPPLGFAGPQGQGLSDRLDYCE